MKKRSDLRENDDGLSVETRQGVVAGLRLLLQMAELVNEATRIRWQCALSMLELQTAGANASIVRWFLQQRLVEQRVEATGPGATRRTFGRTTILLQKRSCFLLTEQGRKRALAIIAEEDAILGQTGGGRKGHGRRAGPRPQPRWDAGQGKLLVGYVVLHQYPPQAHNIIALLDALEEWQWLMLPENWLDDPLPGKGDVDRQRRLHEAVDALNRGQQPHLVKFVVRRDAKALGWKWLDAPLGTTDRGRSR